MPTATSIHRTNTNYHTHTTHATPVLTDYYYYTTTYLRVQFEACRPRTHRDGILDAWLATDTQ
jgi:hypothetical protein